MKVVPHEDPNFEKQSPGIADEPALGTIEIIPTQPVSTISNGNSALVPFINQHKYFGFMVSGEIYAHESFSGSQLLK